MVDMANFSQLAMACVEFLTLLSHKGLQKKNILVLLNKMYVLHVVSLIVLLMNFKVISLLQWSEILFNICFV